MGDQFQSVVDPDASEVEAPALAEKLLQWFINEGIVSPERSDCVLGDSGYAPGRFHCKAIGSENQHLLRLRTNGLEVVSTHTVFHNGGLGFELVCESCGGSFDPPQGAWGDAVGEWYDRSGPGLLACPGCQAVRAITKWRHAPPFGFANLGFTFWNWPSLLESFIGEISERLGHNVTVVVGKV